MRKAQVIKLFEAFHQEHFYSAHIWCVVGGVKRPGIQFKYGGVGFYYCPVKNQVIKSQARDYLTFDTPQAVIAYLSEMEAMKSLDPNYRHKHA